MYYKKTENFSAFWKNNLDSKDRIVIGEKPNKSICIRKLYPIIFYHFKKLLYQLCHIILQYSQHLNFYFTTQYIKIIFLHNKIIYPKIISILSHLSPLSNFHLSSNCNFHRSLHFRRGGEIVRSHNLIQPLSQCWIYNNTKKSKLHTPMIQNWFKIKRIIFKSNIIQVRPHCPSPTTYHCQNKTHKWPTKT